MLGWLREQRSDRFVAEGSFGLPKVGVQDQGCAQGTICLLDFDLEAPSIDGYPQFAPPSQDQRGVLDYIRHFEEKDFADSILPYVYPAHVNRSCRGDPARGEPGGWRFVSSEVLFVMRAGSIGDPAYVEYLSNMDWNRLYREKQCGWMFENLRAGLKQELKCDYLLVDSRPGLNRLGGVCMGHLADAAVLVFQPTVAHLAGLAQVVGRLRERERTEERRIPRLYVATRFMRPSEDSDHDAAWLQAMKIVRACEDDYNWDELERMNAREIDRLVSCTSLLDPVTQECDGGPAEPVQLTGVHWRNRQIAAIDPPQLLEEFFPWCEPSETPDELACESGSVAHWVIQSRWLWEAYS